VKIWRKTWTNNDKRRRNPGEKSGQT